MDILSSTFAHNVEMADRNKARITKAILRVAFAASVIVPIIINFRRESILTPLVYRTIPDGVTGKPNRRQKKPNYCDIKS